MTSTVRRYRNVRDQGPQRSAADLAILATLGSEQVDPEPLIWDTDVPSDSVDVRVHDGWVTLRGNVRYQYQGNAAYEDVARLHGVVDVTNEIKVNAR